MDCSIPPPLTEDELSEALDGEASAAVQQHLAQCAYCEDRLEAARWIEQRLKTQLYRFDCPTSQELIDYDSRLLDSAEAAKIQKHIETCPRCQDELKVLQRYMDDEKEAAPSLQLVRSGRQHSHERIAQPKPDVGAWAARGLQDGESQDWEADGATIFLELKRRTEGLVLSGQVVDEDPIWEGALAELRQAGALQGVSVLDEMGEFRFTLGEPAPVDLNITASNGLTLVLENITLTE
jgi:hypothetical protein